MDKTARYFDRWASTGRAEEMEKGHGNNVNKFLDKIDLKLGQRIRPGSLYSSSNMIKQIYQEDGYFNVEVESSIEAPQDTLVRNAYARDVIFTIKENE